MSGGGGGVAGEGGDRWCPRISFLWEVDIRLAPRGEIVLCIKVVKVSLKISKTGKGRQEGQKKRNGKERETKHNKEKNHKNI